MFVTYNLFFVFAFIFFLLVLETNVECKLSEVVSKKRKWFFCHNSTLIYLDVIVHLWPRQKSNSTALISSPSHPHHWEVFKGWWSSRCTRIVQMYYFDWDFESARLLNSFLNHELKIRCTNWCWWMKVKYYSCIF